MWTVVAVAAVLAALVPPAASAGDAPATVQRVDLTLVPLQKAQLGASGKTLALARDSGVVPNNVAGDSSFTGDPSTFKKLGRVIGYRLDYGDAFRGGAGVTQIQTSAEVYKTAAAAKKGLAFWKKDDSAIKALGKAGLNLTTKSPRVPAVGKQRFAYLWTVSVTGAAPVTTVDERWTNGVYVLQVKVAAGSASGASSLAPKLAKMLDNRLDLALIGRLHATAAKLPPHRTAGPPSGGPDLSTLVLQQGDVAGGPAQIQDQAYFVDPEALAAYEIYFESTGSPWSQVSQEIEWYSTANEATYWAGYDQALFTALIAGSGPVTPVDLSSVGDNAVGSEIQVPGGGTAYIVLIGLSRGKAMDFVIAEAQTAIQATDIQTLATSVASRLDAGLPSP